MRVHIDVLRSACEQWLQEQYLQFFAPFESLLEPDLPVVLIPTGSMSRLPFQAFHDGLGYINERWNLRVTRLDQLTGQEKWRFSDPTRPKKGMNATASASGESSDISGS